MLPRGHYPTESVPFDNNSDMMAKTVDVRPRTATCRLWTVTSDFGRLCLVITSSSINPSKSPRSHAEKGQSIIKEIY